MNEHVLIDKMKAQSQGFIGDDAATLPPLGQGLCYVISKDILIEDVHF
jgi:thiamine monophosphate kinase